MYVRDVYFNRFINANNAERKKERRIHSCVLFMAIFQNTYPLQTVKAKYTYIPTCIHTNYTKLILRGLRLYCGNTIHNLGVRLLAVSDDAAVHVPALLTLPALDVLLPLS